MIATQASDPPKGAHMFAAIVLFILLPAGVYLVWSGSRA